MPSNFHSLKPGPAHQAAYIHLPFCRLRCSYCAFAISTDQSLETSYVTALVKEIRASREQARCLESLFFGGGTPSRLSLESFGRIFDALRAEFSFAVDCEISIEANPEDVTGESLRGWTDLGINRLSLGVQSLHNDELLPLGRVHGRDKALAALALASSSPQTLSADLILGLPRQTAATFQQSLEEVVDSGVDHISVYLLDIEQGTPLQTRLSSGAITIPEDGLVADCYKAMVELLAGRGLQQYEVSNFARVGRECRHNSRYWSREPYFGFGMGAHSFDGETRLANAGEIERYIQLMQSGDSAVVTRERLSEEDVRHEKLFLQLRQRTGIEYSQLVALCGSEAERWVVEGRRAGWLRKDEDRVAFTADGFLVSNELISQLF